MIRILVLLVLGYLAFRLARRWLRGRTVSGRMNHRENGRIDDVMIKDPQCGAYFPRRDGIPLKSAGGGLLFCSRECRDKYLVARSESGD
jgi:uncharacterized protein